MEQVLTLVCKLKPTPEQVVKIEATLKAFADACNHANQQVKPQITSKTSIKNMVYQDLRSKFLLSANLAVRACARVGANRKTSIQQIPVRLTVSATDKPRSTAFFTEAKIGQFIIARTLLCAKIHF